MSIINIACLTGDELLIDALTSQVYVTTVQWDMFTSPDEFSERGWHREYSFILVSDRLFTLESLEEWLQHIQANLLGAKVVVLLSNYHHAARNNQYWQLCERLQVRALPPGRGSVSIAEICKELINECRPDTGMEKLQPKGKVICYIGSTPNIGTTVTSFGTAYSLAQETDETIGYLCLNLKSSKLHRYLGREERVFTLDGLRAELKAKSLRKERLLQVCEALPEAPNLKLLFGNMLREQAEFFTSEEIEHLLRIAREAFDVCIVDVNAYWDNAATVCSVLQSDARVVVTTGDITQFQEDLTKWIGQVGSVFGLEPHSFELVAVQMEKQSHSDSLTVRDIRKETQMLVIGKIHKYPDLVRSLNRGKLTELLQRGQPIRSELSSITQRFIAKYSLAQRTAPVKLSWFKRFIAGPKTI